MIAPAVRPAAFIVTGCTRGNLRTKTSACAKHTAPPATDSKESSGTASRNGERDIKATPASARSVPTTAAAWMRS